MTPHASDMPYEVLKFAPKKTWPPSGGADDAALAIVGMLRTARQQLGDAQNRIHELEDELSRAQHRADRAEVLLRVLEKEIDDKLIGPAAAARARFDELSP